MIEHRHVWLEFGENKPVELRTMRINGSDNRYKVDSLTFSSKNRLELVLKNWMPYISFHIQMVFWDAIKEMND